MNKTVKSYIYKGNIFNFIVLTFNSLCQTAGLIIISLMLEKVMAIAASEDIDALINHGKLFIILFVLFVIIYLLEKYIKPKYQKKALLQYKNNIYNGIINKSISNFNKNNTATYISLLTNDVKIIEDNYIFSAFDLITNVTLFISTIVIMILYSPLLTLAALGLSIFPFVGALLIGGKLELYEKRISDQNASFMHFLKDNLIGFSTIKVFKAEKKIKSLFKKNNDDLEKEKASKTKVLVLMDMAQTIMSLLAQFGVFFIGAYISIKTGSIAPSVIILFVQLMNYILNPLIQIPTLLSKRHSCKPLFKKAEDIIKNVEEETKLEIKEFEKISISNLEFSYDEKIIINNINYTFNKYKSYAVVGESGSGKTTLLNLLLGKENTYLGKIKYNDKEVRDLSLDSLFEISAFVEQNVFVFDDSIINNITMYSKIEDEILNKAIKKSGLSKLIEEKGPNYRCGENGSNLSGGEKQRISIARALIKDVQLLLLDEATSALDNETAISVIDNILAIENVTKIIITHKLDEEILTKFDEIIVMKNGKIVETGKFSELINNNSIFKSLVEYNE